MKDLLIGRYVEYASRDYNGKVADWIPARIVSLSSKMAKDGYGMHAKDVMKASAFIACFDGTIREALLENLSTILRSREGYFLTCDGNKHYCEGDSYHREDGPAVIFADGTKQYWYLGQYFKEYDEWFDILDDKEGAIFNIGGE